jgi:acetate---CoA ligase (ADP-forming)
MEQAASLAPDARLDGVVVQPQIRVPPFTWTSARAMIDEIRGARLLEGGDVAALVNAVMRLQRLALEVGDETVELDINPLMVLPTGRGVVAVDALVVGR